MRRRKIINCPVCGEGKLLLTEDKICWSCKGYIELGKLTEKRAKEAEDTVMIILGDSFVYRGEKLRDELKDPMKFSHFRFEAPRISDLIMTIADVTYTTVSYYSHSDEFLDIFAIHQSNNKKAVVTRKQAEAIQTLADLIAGYIYTEHQAGVEKGQSLLLGLADGSVSVEDFNDRNLKR